MRRYPIPNHKGYAVTKCGRVFSQWQRTKKSFPYYSIVKRWRELKPEIGKRGRPRVTIKRESGGFRRVFVAELILETFVGPRPDGMEVCHFPDRSTLNNSIDNLRWDTHQSNLHDRVIHGTVPLGDKHVGTKIPDACIPSILQMRARGQGLKEIAQMFGVTYQRIHQIVKKGGR